MPQLYELNTSPAAEGIRERTFSPEDLVESLLGRIDALEPALANDESGSHLPILSSLC